MNSPPGSRLFIVCGHACSEEVLRRACSQYGAIQHIRMLREKGVAYVKFPTASEAARAQENLHLETLKDGATIVQLKVLLADPPETKAVPPYYKHDSHGSNCVEDPDNTPPRSRLFLVVPRDCSPGPIEEEMRKYEGLEYVKADLVQTKGVIYVKYKTASSALKAMEDIQRNGYNLVGNRVKVFVAEPKSSSREGHRDEEHRRAYAMGERPASTGMLGQAVGYHGHGHMSRISPSMTMHDATLPDMTRCVGAMSADSMMASGMHDYLDSNPAFWQWLHSQGLNVQMLKQQPYDTVVALRNAWLRACQEGHHHLVNLGSDDLGSGHGSQHSLSGNLNMSTHGLGHLQRMGSVASNTSGPLHNVTMPGGFTSFNGAMGLPGQVNAYGSYSNDGGSFNGSHVNMSLPQQHMHGSMPVSSMPLHGVSFNLHMSNDASGHFAAAGMPGGDAHMAHCSDEATLHSGAGQAYGTALKATMRSSFDTASVHGAMASAPGLVQLMPQAMQLPHDDGSGGLVPAGSGGLLASGSGGLAAGGMWGRASASGRPPSMQSLGAMLHTAGVLNAGHSQAWTPRHSSCGLRSSWNNSRSSDDCRLGSGMGVHGPPAPTSPQHTPPGYVLGSKGSRQLLVRLCAASAADLAPLDGYIVSLLQQYEGLEFCSLISGPDANMTVWYLCQYSMPKQADRTKEALTDVELPLCSLHIHYAMTEPTLSSQACTMHHHHLRTPSHHQLHASGQWPPADAIQDRPPLAQLGSHNGSQLAFFDAGKASHDNRDNRQTSFCLHNSISGLHAQQQPQPQQLHEQQMYRHVHSQDVGHAAPVAPPQPPGPLAEGTASGEADSDAPNAVTTPQAEPAEPQPPGSKQHPWPQPGPDVVFLHMSRDKMPVYALENLMQQHGEVEYVVLHGQDARYGAVKFADARGAQEAQVQCHQFNLHGCIITCVSADISPSPLPAAPAS